MHTVVPLRGIAASGFATDPGLSAPLSGFSAPVFLTARGPRDPRPIWARTAGRPRPSASTGGSLAGIGCRSATTGAVACLALHPERRRSDAARNGVDHLLARETRDAATLGWEVSRLVGLERAMGQITFYVTFDPVFMLDLASRCGVSLDDRRVRDLVGWLEALRGPYGLWDHQAHPQLARWLTFDIESSLGRLAEGDWIGNEEPVSFTPYKRGRRRH